MRCPTLSTAVKYAAASGGWAARDGEREKRSHYKGTFDERRWVLVPFAQETYGRLGEDARVFVRQLACHSAACRGGDDALVRRRAAIVQRRIVVELGYSLARNMAERLRAYMRGAVKAGRATRPVSALLTLTSA